MRGIEAVGDLDCQIEDFIRAERLSLNPVLERVAFEELHRNEVPAFMLVDVVDGADVGVIQCGGCLGFALESLKGMAVSGQLFGQELQGDGARSLVSSAL